MLMRFIGKNGSLGYRYGQVYEVEIHTIRGQLLLLSKGHVNCPYGSLRALMKNWEELNH